MGSWLLSVWTEHIDEIQATLTSAGLIAGGLWAWWLFRQQRHRQFRANVEHRLVHWRADTTNIVRATVRFTNVGTSMIRLTGMRAWAQQVAPPPEEFTAALGAGDAPISVTDAEYPWPLVGDVRELDWSSLCLEVEPGETEEHNLDFVVPLRATPVAVYSYIPNIRKDGKGWNTTSIYHLEEAVPRSDTHQLPGGTQGPAKSPPPPSPPPKKK
jgi:hypothetical protein